jgi:hypothetical protein
MSLETRAGLLMYKGTLSELSDEEQAKIKKCADQLREVTDAAGECGEAALILVGLELSDELS